MIVPNSSVHQAAARSESRSGFRLPSYRASTSHITEIGTSAAVKFTKMG